MANLPSHEDSEALALGGYHWAQLAMALEEQVKDVRRPPRVREEAERQLIHCRRCYHMCAAAGRWWPEERAMPVDEKPPEDGNERSD